MEQGSPSLPNLQSLDRLTGQAVFFPAGTVGGGVDLGDIAMHAISYGAQREKVRFPVSRSVLIEIDETVCLAPVYSIEGQQFHSAIIPYLLLAKRNANATQLAATNVNVTLVAQPEQTFDLGARFIRNVTALVGSALLSPNADYFVETETGLIRFPVTGGIMGGESVTVRFDQPLIVRRSYTAFDQLEFPGRLLIFEMEASRPVPKVEWSMPGNLTCDAPGEGDPVRHRKWKLRFSLTAQPIVIRRDETNAVVTAGTIPSNALVDENGNPIVDESGNFILLS
jgi:hypothetical protein